jgi:uncharacterized protein
MSAGARRARLRVGFTPSWLLTLAGLLTLAATAPPAQASGPATGLQPIPNLSARVTDVTGTLTAEQQTRLGQGLAAFESAKGAQLAVLIVPTTAPEEIEGYSIRVVEQWKLGRSKVDDGALLLVAKNDHRVRIEVGRGLEGVLTDALTNRIIEESITPAFRRGDFYGGIEAGVEQMMKLIQGESLPPPPHDWQSGRHRGSSNSLVLLIFAVAIGSALLRAIFGRTVGSVLTGGVAGLLVWLTVHILYAAGLAALAGFVFAMGAGLARGSGWSSYSGTSWGGFGGGLGGGGGGGGFSGGGGGFAGGGASGSW